MCRPRPPLPDPALARRSAPLQILALLAGFAVIAFADLVLLAKGDGGLRDARHLVRDEAARYAGAETPRLPGSRR